MTSIKEAPDWNALSYLQHGELIQIDKEFSSSLLHAECLVFWTGMKREIVQQWSDQNGLKTLTSAMGPLMDPQNPRCPRNRKTGNEWSKYVKGASIRFAEYACQDRKVVVLTNPPPNIYSSRENSTFRQLEEPILKEVYGGPKVQRIDYVHLSSKEAGHIRYQVWPLDCSNDWIAFFDRGLLKAQAIKSRAAATERPIWQGNTESKPLRDKEESGDKQTEIARGIQTEAERKRVTVEKEAKTAMKYIKAEAEQKKRAIGKEAKRATGRIKAEAEQKKSTAKTEAKKGAKSNTT